VGALSFDFEVLMGSYCCCFYFVAITCWKIWYYWLTL